MISKIAAKKSKLCIVRGCRKHLSLSEKQNRLTRCLRCRSRTVLGVKIKSEKLWTLRKFMVSYVRKGHGVWHLRCKKRGCADTYAYSVCQGSKRMFCKKHRVYYRENMPFSAPYATLKRVAAQFNRKFNISYKWFADFCRRNATCAYCNRDVKRTIFHQENKGLSRSPFLDRINPKRGYTTQNVVTCCLTCNMTKMDALSPQEQMVVSAMRNNDPAGAKKILLQKERPRDWPSQFWSLTFRQANNAMTKKLRKRAQLMKDQGIKRNGIISKKAL